MQTQRWGSKQEFQDDFFAYAANGLYLDKNINSEIFYAKDYDFVIKRYALLGKVKGVRSKVLVLDNDDTLNPPGYKKNIFFNWLDGLAQQNPAIKKRRDKIEEKASNLMAKAQAEGELLVKNQNNGILKRVKTPYTGSFHHELKELVDELRRDKLTKDQHKIACETAAKKTELVMNCLQAVTEIEEMGFIPRIDSSSPTDANVIFGEQKLQIPGPRIQGSDFKFDDKGYLENIRTYSGCNKVLAKDEIIKKENCSPHGWVLVDDNFRADAYLATTFGYSLVVWAPNDKEIPDKLPGKIYVKLPEIRTDMMYLVDFIRRYEKARVFTFFKDPKSMDTIIKKIRNINELADKCKTASKDSEINEFAKRVNLETLQLLELYDPVFPKLSSGIIELTDELSFTKDTERRKSLTDDIRNVINKVTPEAKASGDFIEGLKPFVEEFESLYRREEW